MKRILSIDWDFFIKEDPMLDMGHREDGFFLNGMWEIREATWHEPVEKTLPMVEKPLVVALVLRDRFSVNEHTQAATAESHAPIFDWAKKIAGDDKLEIINVDAHHDISYKTGFGVADCGNWAGRLMAEGVLKNYTIIYPDWRVKHPETSKMADLLKIPPKKLLVNISVWYWQDWVDQNRKVKPIDGIYVCRSGCWTPPCYDEKFNDFCKVMTGIPKALPPRKLNQAEIKKQRKALKEFYDKNRNENIIPRPSGSDTKRT